MGAPHRRKSQGWGVGEQRMYSKGVDGNTEDSITMGRNKPKSKTARFRVLLLL